MKRISTLAALMICSLAGSAHAALSFGVLDDFEDGTLGGWAPPTGNTVNVAGGPAGSTRYLQIDPASRLAAFDSGINGIIDPAVNAIQFDIFRPVGFATAEIRLVLFGPGTNNRWTSTASQVVPSDAIWNTYTFSILQSDLTQVAGAGTYADLTSNLNRVMVRHDAGAPSAGGTPVVSTFGSIGIDNVTAVPEPTALTLLALGAVALAPRRRRPN